MLKKNLPVKDAALLVTRCRSILPVFVFGIGAESFLKDTFLLVVLGAEVVDVLAAIAFATLMSLFLLCYSNVMIDILSVGGGVDGVGCGNLKILLHLFVDFVSCVGIGGELERL